MLPKENRLKKNKDFEMVFKKGKGFSQNFLFLKFIKNNLKVTRFGFVVSKKVSKKAVIRNRIKRRLREIVRKKIAEIEKGRDIIIIVIPDINSDFKALRDAVDKIFVKAGILKKRKA